MREARSQWPALAAGGIARAGPAAACPVCAERPEARPADRLLGAEAVVIAGDAPASGGLPMAAGDALCAFALAGPGLASAAAGARFRSGV